MTECITCKDTTCTNFIKKIFHKEAEHGQIVEFTQYFCCYDNGIARNMLKYWCNECLSNPKVRQRIVAEVVYNTPKVRNTNPYKKWIDLK